MVNCETQFQGRILAMLRSNILRIPRRVGAVLALGSMVSLVGVVASCAKDTDPNTRANQALQKQHRDQKERTHKENYQLQKEKIRQNETVRESNLKKQTDRDKLMKDNRSDSKSFPRKEKILEPKKQDENPSEESKTDDDSKGSFQ
jgi:hypothetical protein